jgi:hypothetical protein
MENQEIIVIHPTEYLREVIKIVLGVDVKTAKSRKRMVVNARMIYSYILHKNGWGYSAIGKCLVKHHATIIHYVKNFENYKKGDLDLRRQYIEVKNSFSEGIFNEVSNLSEDELKKELILLTNKNKSLSLYITELEEKLKSVVYNNKRLNDIYKIIEERTKVGAEENVKWAINRMYNGI